MAASTSTLAFNYDTDARFRAFWSPLSAALAAAGWSKVWDNINWGTVAKPVLTNTSAGGEVWAMGDSLQGTAPKFLKLEYGTSSSVTSPGLWITTGTAHDGAGNLSGNGLSRYLMNITAQTASYECRYSGDSSLFCCMYGQTGPSSTPQFGFSVERSHNSSGTDTVDGCLVLVYEINAAYSHYAPTAGINPSEYAAWNAALPPTGTGALGADSYLFPVRSWAPGETCASLCFFVYSAADLTASNPTAATLWDGSSHMVLPGGASMNTNTAKNLGGSGCLAMRYD